MAISPLDYILQGARNVLDKGKDAFRDETNLGIAKNTVLGLPQAVNKLFYEQSTAPQRYIQQKTGLKSQADRDREIIAQARASQLPAQRLDQFGFPMAQIGRPTQTVPDILQTKLSPNEIQLLAEERATMAAGFAGYAPQKKLLTGVATQIAKTTNLGKIASYLKQEIPQITDDVANKFAGVFRNVTDPQKIDTVVNRLKFQMQGKADDVVANAQAILKTGKPLETPSPLMVEAKNYKSAEEFIKNETETLYRVAPKFPKDTWEAGTYFSNNPNTARYYAESHYKGDPSDLKVMEVKLPSKLIYERSAGGANVRLKESFPVSEAEVKSQLTDIWKQAQVKPIVEASAKNLISPAKKAPQPAGLAKVIEKQLKPSLSPMITQKARESTRLKDRIKLLARGARDGSIGTKEQIKATQQELTDIIKTIVPLEEQGKFLTTVRSIQTPEQLKSAMPKIQERISSILDRVEARQIKSAIAKELKEKTIKTDKSGVRVGKVTIEAQKKLGEIAENLKLTQDQASDALEDLMASIKPSTEMTEELTSRISLLRYASGMGDNKIASKLLADIKSIKETGKTLRESQLQNEAARIERLQDSFLNVITGGRGLKPGTGSVLIDLPSDERGLLASLAKAGNSAEDAALMYTFVLDKMSRGDTTSKYMQSPLNKWWSNVFEARNVQDRATDAGLKAMSQGIESVYGFKPNTRDFRKLLTDWIDTKKELGVFRNVFGDEVTLKMTPDQMMYHWGQQQNPNVLPTYKETMGWTDEMIKSVDNALTDKQKDFVRVVAEGKDSLYGRLRSGEIDGINLDKIVERQFGAPLGTVDGFYIPLSREVDLPAHLQTLQDNTRLISTKPSAIKRRVANQEPIRLDSGLIQTTTRHIQEMAHYKAFSDFINDGRKIFKGDVRIAIKQNFRDGDNLIKITDQIFNDLAKDGVEGVRNLEKLNILRGNTAVAFIGVNPVSAIKQYVSVIAWAGEMPTTKFAKGMADFSTNPLEKARFLIENSQTLKSRYNLGALERDIQQGLKTGEIGKLSKSTTAREVFTILTRINDRVAIVGGGWGKYIYELGQLTGQKVPTEVSALREFIKKYPKEHQKAMGLFEEATLRTQQAGNIENMAQLQRMGSFGDLFTLFQSAPIAQFGNTLSTLRAMGLFGDPKRLLAGEGLKRLFIYLVAIPSMLQFIADGFEVKPRRQAAAVGASVGTLGFSNYPLFLGQLAVNAGRAAAGLPVFDLGTPAPATVLAEFTKAMERNRDIVNDVSFENIFQLMKDASIAIGTLKGIPMKPSERIITGAIDTAKGGDPRRLIGYSDFALSDQGAEKSSTQTLKGIKKTISDQIESGQIDIETAKASYVGLKNKLAESRKKERLELPFAGYKKALADDIEDGLISVEDAKTEYLNYKKEEDQQAKREETMRETYPDRKAVELIVDYAKAFKTDPVVAWKGMMTKEKLDEVKGSKVTLQRFFGEHYLDPEKGSEAYMKKALADLGIAWKDRANYNLEHIVPLTAGGDNSNGNLQIISRALHNSYTPVDVLAGKAVESGRLSRRQVARIMRQLKIDKSITVDQAIQQLNG